MKKGWISKKVHENWMGLHFTRWYIKSPSGNFYELYRGAYGPSLFLTRDVNDSHKSLRMNSILSEDERKTMGICTFNRALQEIYKIEASGKYPKSLSNDVENDKECKELYASSKSSHSYYSY
jgi:hypothetical protein